MAVNVMKCLPFLLSIWSLQAVTGIVISRQDNAFQVLTVSRQVLDNLTEVIEVHFRASRQPQVEWITFDFEGDIVQIPDTATDLQYASGRGVASLTFAPEYTVMVRLGYFDTYSITLEMRQPEGQSQGRGSHVIQTLNSRQPLLSSAGYDIGYGPGESFEVIMDVPRHQAEGFSWFLFWEDMPQYYDVNVKGYWRNTEANSFHAAMSFYKSSANMGRFLYVNQTLGDDSMSVQLTFTTSDEQVDGFLQVESMSVLDDSIDSPRIVTQIIDYTYLAVHEASIPGPFPPGYTNIRSTHNFNNGITRCTRADSRDCDVRCRGFGNHIVSASILKVEADGSRTPVPGVKTQYRNSHWIEHLYTNLNETEGFAGTYVCQIRTLDGGIGEATFEVAVGYPSWWGG